MAEPVGDGAHVDAGREELSSDEVAEVVAELTDEVIDITVEHSLRIRSPRTSYPIFHLGGAVGRVGEDETAFNGRAAGHTYNINGIAPG